MNDAVESLIADTEKQAKPSDVTAAVEVPPTAGAVTPEPTPSVELATSVKSPTSSVTLAGKKVIKPLNDLSNNKADLNKLLAKEEASTTAATPAAPQPAAKPAEPGPAAPAATPESQAPPIITPTTPPQFGDTDPNSIAL